MTEREVMQYDVAVVGAGPAGLACAIRLRQLDPERPVCVLEKAAEIGAHALSGAVMQPDALDGLLPAWRDDKPDICVPAKRDEFLFLTAKRRVRLPTPPQMNNRGNFILSQGQLCRWLGAQAEQLGADVFPGFAAARALFDDAGTVVGVGTGDMGREKDGSEGPNFAPGVDIHAGVTVLAEGCRGSLSKALIERFDLQQGRSGTTYGLGLKELWQLPPGRVEPGLVQHTIGWPLDNRTYGGSFVYHLDNDQLYVGFVIGLDYEDPEFRPFEAFQQFKHHPAVRPLLEGGEIISGGARCVTEGGHQSAPRRDMPGAILAGEAGVTLNVPKIKGIHLALRSGMLAAEHIVERGESAGFDERFRASPAGAELRKVRNIRPGFRWGLWPGLANAALETVTLGKLPWTLKNHTDWSNLEKLAEYESPDRQWPARELPPRDRLASVYFAATSHDENQPNHLQILEPDICTSRCTEEYGNPCTRFCPAAVYEMVDDGAAGKRLQINSANCVHCKACDIKDPYEIINWVTPEGGSGPNYQGL
ncbi:MAG: 4Fe-4S dicluster domain-containing protein [Gammaproteobacteria bacterium]